MSVMDLLDYAPPPVGVVTGAGGEDVIVPVDFSKLVEGCEFNFDIAPIPPAPILQLNGHTISTPGTSPTSRPRPRRGKRVSSEGLFRP